MITNLPNDFPLERINEFDFGSAEAMEDNLLLNCPCHLKAIDEFLTGKKDIVLGERGAGKTALLRLICAQSFNFTDHEKRNQVIIPIEEELEYIALKEQLLSRIGDQPIQSETKYRLVWEIFVLYRLIQKLTSEFPNETEISKLRDQLNMALGVSEQKQTLLKFLLSQKKTFGVKLENTVTGFPVPNLYASMEPSQGIPTDASKETLLLDLEEYKREIQTFLRKQKAVAYILIDKLDEFVVKEAYDIQKDMLQGLLACQRSYGPNPDIKIKLFLRFDLFSRLNFQSLGYDKVISKTVNLKWEPEDIRQLIAKRISFNLFRIFDLPHIHFTVEDEHLYLRKNALKEAAFSGLPAGGRARFLTKIKRIYWSIRTKLELARLDIRDARRTNFIDEINRQIISSVLPRRPNHLTITGKTEPIDVFKYLETHFALGAGCATPRAVLAFLQKCLEHTRDYYRRNPDQTIRLDANKEYPLILRDCITNAYQEFQEQIWETFANVDNTWKKLVYAIRSGRDGFHQSKITYKQISRILSDHTIQDDEIRRFLAFIDHVGLIMCLTPNQSYENRMYELPILFQKAREQRA